MTHLHDARSCITPRQFWSQHREATLNWLALGLLLAAWNASDNDAARDLQPPINLCKGHKSVNVL
ncbi:MAG TPA: hypothetical protein VKG05_08080 [Steroidobacteraceae bacterium]|nr:hypothetical protein [Steroidobacteraceae bacterium]